MKICLVHNRYGRISGEEIVVDELEKLLEKRGHVVIPFVRSSEEAAEMRFGQIKGFFSGIYNKSSREAMKVLLDRHRPDVVHLHNVYPFISPSILCECGKKRVPVVMTVHNYRLVCPNGMHVSKGEICEKCTGGREYWCILRNCEDNIFKSFGYALRNWVARKMKFFTNNVTIYACLTQFQRQRLISEGYPANRITVIPNMVGLNGFESGSQLGKHVGFIGRVSPEKGIKTLLAVANKYPEIPFKIAGTYDRMENLLREAPFNLDFLGHLPKNKIIQFYRNCRIVILPNIWFEGFPMTIAEAMMNKKPVICSMLGGLPEIVENGVTGLLFQAGNTEDLGDKIKYLWTRPNLCWKMGKAGKEKAMREYSPDKYYERIMLAYKKAIELTSRRKKTVCY